MTMSLLRVILLQVRRLTEGFYRQHLLQETKDLLLDQEILAWQAERELKGWRYDA
jgi:hypothetical protein